MYVKLDADYTHKRTFMFPKHGGRTGPSSSNDNAPRKICSFRSVIGTRYIHKMTERVATNEIAVVQNYGAHRQ